MRNPGMLVLFFIVFVSGCVTTADKKRAVSSVDHFWQGENDRFMAENGHRSYPVGKTDAYAAVLSTFTRMNLIVINQDTIGGLVLGSAPCPLPLTASEWQHVVDEESADLRRIVVSEVGFMGSRYRLDPVGKDTLVNVLVRETGQGVDVSISFRLQTQQYGEDPVRTQAPPTAVVLGINKFWRLLDEALAHQVSASQVMPVRERDRQPEIQTLQTEKSVCTSMSDGNFTLNDARVQLMNQAKAEAASEFFGEKVTSRSEVTNFVLTADHISSESGGIVRLKGTPAFFNGQSLGEICMKAVFYVTAGDLRKLEPQEMSEQDLCYAGDVASVEKLRLVYPQVAVSRVLSRSHPQFAQGDLKSLAGLARNLAISNEKVVSANVLCADIRFEVIPLELELFERLNRPIADSGGTSL